MRTVTFLAALLLWALPLAAQTTTFQDSLLDHLTGTWVLRGTIEGTETTHDVTAAWVLGHQYLELHEVSREKNEHGSPVYEATVYLGWDKPLASYDCLWLDVTGGGGLTGHGIGHGRRTGDTIPLLFAISDSVAFHTTFQYDRTNDRWQWIMDGEMQGKLEPFARLTLIRNP